MLREQEIMRYLIGILLIILLHEVIMLAKLWKFYLTVV